MTAGRRASLQDPSDPADGIGSSRPCRARLRRHRSGLQCHEQGTPASGVGLELDCEGRMISGKRYSEGRSVV